MFESVISLAGAQTADIVQPANAGEALGLGGIVTLAGVLIVFAALVCLILITWLYPKIAMPLIKKTSEARAARTVKKAQKQAAEDNAISPVGTAPAVASVPAAQPAGDDDALIAVITAAVAASMGASSNGIRIKSLRRSQTSTPAWGVEGRNEQVYNRF